MKGFAPDAFLTEPGLAARGVAHGFGRRDSPPVAGLVRPRQVHGTRVACVAAPGADPGEADALVATAPGVPIGVLTADCVPLLLASGSGAAVAAVHAGWRGLAAGVVEAGAAALRRQAPDAELRAALGPHIGPCCYEVDEPVFAALRARFGGELEAALTPTRPAHARLDLARLVRSALARAGIAADAIGAVQPSCTQCHPRLFHSYRRDGARAGRLVHWIGVAPGA